MSTTISVSGFGISAFIPDERLFCHLNILASHYHINMLRGINVRVIWLCAASFALRRRAAARSAPSRRT